MSEFDDASVWVARHLLMGDGRGCPKRSDDEGAARYLSGMSNARPCAGTPPLPSSSICPSSGNPGLSGGQKGPPPGSIIALPSAAPTDPTLQSQGRDPLLTLSAAAMTAQAKISPPATLPHLLPPDLALSASPSSHLARRLYLVYDVPACKPPCCSPCSRIAGSRPGRYRLIPTPASSPFSL